MILTSILYSSGVAALLNHLKRHRLNARLSQGGLAARAGVSRQAYAAVESGKSAPSTELALRLSRALATQVDLLFSLADEPPPAMQAELMEVPEDYPAGTSPGPRRARIWRVGGRLLARPVWGPSVAPQSLLNTEGVILSPPQDRRRVAVQPFDDEALEVPALAVLGCDPAVALLESGLRGYGVRLVAVEGGSRQALTGLARGGRARGGVPPEGRDHRRIQPLLGEPAGALPVHPDNLRRLAAGSDGEGGQSQGYQRRGGPGASPGTSAGGHRKPGNGIGKPLPAGPIAQRAGHSRGEGGRLRPGGGRSLGGGPNGGLRGG